MEREHCTVPCCNDPPGVLIQLEVHFPMVVQVLVGEDLDDGGFTPGSGRLPEGMSSLSKPRFSQDIAESS